MTHFVLQTCLLLFGAFVIGAALACLLRSLFHRPAASRDAVDQARRAPADLPSAVATGTAAGVAGTDGRTPGAGEPSRAGEDTEPADVKSPAREDTDSSALAGATAVAGAAVAGAAALADAQGDEKRAEAEVEQADAGQTEQADAAAGPDGAATSSEAPEGTDIAGAADEESARVGDETEPFDTGTAEAEPDVGEDTDGSALAGTADVGGEPAPAIGAGTEDAGQPVPYTGFVGAGAVEPKDDLSDIRGIDAEMAGRLNALGVNSFAQLGALTRADVDALETALGETGRVSRQNWIEQAAILAAGSATVHSILRRQRAPSASSAAPHAASPDRPAGVLTGVAVEPEDDLSRIDGIDADTAAWLNTLGVNRYQQITGLTADDVARLNADLGGETTVSRHNWIEQAAILAGGGATLFAFKRDWSGQEGFGSSEGGADTVPDTANSVEELSEDGAEQREAAEAAEASGETTAAPSDDWAGTEHTGETDYAAAHDAPTEVHSGETEPETDEDEGITSTAAAAAAVVAGAALSAGAKARERDEDKHPVETATATATAASGGPDDLTRIRGLGDDDQARLNELGVTRHAEIAAWSARDVSHAGEAVGDARRIAREGWIEQAAMLAKGATTLFAARKGAGLLVRAVNHPRHQSVATPQPSDDTAPTAQAGARSATAGSVEDLPKAAAPGGVVAATTLASTAARKAAAPSGHDPAPAAETSGAPRTDEGEAEGGARGDVSALRSVRSEALTGQRPSTGPAVRSKQADDLKRIRGIGVLVEKKLHSLGVTRYADIAGWTPEDIASISQALGFRGRIERENWVEQANILNHEGQTEFSRRFDRGEVGGSNDGQH